MRRARLSLSFSSWSEAGSVGGWKQDASGFATEMRAPGAMDRRREGKAGVGGEEVKRGLYKS